MSSPIRRVLSVVSPRFGRPIVCEACGQEFSCGMSLRGCWCASVELSDETRAELKALYKDCLCRECLERLSAAVE
ncbi:MAG: cysteine-rich CWC family protein [Pyrinomonadaceae bacterium]